MSEDNRIDQVLCAPEVTQMVKEYEAAILEHAALQTESTERLLAATRRCLVGAVSVVCVEQLAERLGVRG